MLNATSDFSLNVTKGHFFNYTIVMMQGLNKNITHQKNLTLFCMFDM